MSWRMHVVAFAAATAASAALWGCSGGAQSAADGGPAAPTTVRVRHSGSANTTPAAMDTAVHPGDERPEARGAALPTIVGVSELTYVNHGVSGVVRLSAPIQANEAAFFVDPSLRVGQTPGDNQGVEPAERIGQRGRNCYFVAVRRLVPVARPTPGSPTVFGFAAQARGKSGTLTDVALARIARRHVPLGQFDAARTLGCGTAR
jgi:subtilisin family serine protease